MSPAERFRVRGAITPFTLWTPPQGLRPAETAPHPRSGCGQTVKEPSKNRKNGARKRAASKPDDVSVEVWEDFNSQRKRIFTETALNGLRREAEKAGWSVEDALAHATLRGWEGFNAGWVEKRESASGGRPAQSPHEWLAFCEDRHRAARRMGDTALILKWEAAEKAAREKLPKLKVVQ